MERRLTFFTSDWHIGHQNVLKFDNRPFRDLKHMNEVLISNFNAAVAPGSLVYFLGDMGFGNSEELRSVISRLNPCTKVLIIGNHDKGTEAMFKTGFDVVLNSGSFYINKTLVTMSHCPLTGVWREDTSHIKNSIVENWHGEARQFKYTIPDRGQFHLHGHIHSPNSGKSKRILGKQMDVGVAANNYRVVSLSAIESWIGTYVEK